MFECAIGSSDPIDAWPSPSLSHQGHLRHIAVDRIRHAAIDAAVVVSAGNRPNLVAQLVREVLGVTLVSVSSPERVTVGELRLSHAALCFVVADVWGRLNRGPQLLVTRWRKLVHLFSLLLQTLKNDKWSCRDPNLVNQILLYSLGSVVFYKNIKCAFSSIFMVI